MAETNSACDKTPVKARSPAKKYEIITAGPALLCASPGRIKIPELIIAPDAIQKI
jgi:hypothetical protein